MSVQGASAAEVFHSRWFPVMDAGTVIRVHGGSWIIQTCKHIRAADFISHFQGSKKDIPTGVNLKEGYTLERVSVSLVLFTFLQVT